MNVSEIGCDAISRWAIGPRGLYAPIAVGLGVTKKRMGKSDD